MKIHVYAICWNEERFLPFYLDYYSKIAEKIVVFDNYSTDRSVEIIKSYPNTEVRQYSTNNQIVDVLWQEMKNNCWKESRGKADWVIVGDIDEILYHPDMLGFLGRVKEQGYNVLNPVPFNMYSDIYPIYSGKPIYEILKTGFETDTIPGARGFGKQMMFNPNEILDINYLPGAHRSSPVANSGYAVKIWNSLDNNKILKLLHYKYLGAEYLEARHKVFNSRLSEENLKMGYSKHYTMWETVKTQYDQLRQHVKPVL